MKIFLNNIFEDTIDITYDSPIYSAQFNSF